MASSNVTEPMGEIDPTEIQFWIQKVGSTSLTENKAQIALNPPLLELINSVCLYRVLGAYGNHFLAQPKHLLVSDPTMSGHDGSRDGTEQHTLNAAGTDPKNLTAKSAEQQKALPSYKIWHGTGMKLLRTNIENAVREGDQFWKELESFGASLDDNRQFVSRYLIKTNSHATTYTQKHLESDIGEEGFKNEVRKRYLSILHSFNNFEEGITDKTTLTAAIIDKSDKKIFKSYDQQEYNKFKVSSECLSHETRLLPDTDHSCLYSHNTSQNVIPPVRRIVKRQIASILTTLGATIIGFIGGYSSDNAYSRQQIASITKVLDQQNSELVSLEHLVKTEFAISQSNFIEITESLGKIFDLVAQAKMLIKVEHHEILCNAFVAHMSQAAREIGRFMGQVKEIFNFGLSNRFPGHLLDEDETKDLLSDIKGQAGKKGLELFVNSKEALFGSACNLASHGSQFFLLCAIPLKTKSPLTVQYIPAQKLLIGNTVVSLDLPAKYIFSDGSMYKVMTENKFFHNCRTLATTQEDFVSCKSEPNTFYTREQPKNSQNCAYRIVNGILTDLARFCPFTIVPNQSEHVKQLSDSKYLITPLQGEIVVTQFCSGNNRDHQISVSEPTEMEIKPGCRIFAPQTALGEGDLVSGEVYEISIQGSFRQMVSTSVEVFEQLGSFVNGDQFFENVKKAEIIPKLNTSLPFKELNNLITHNTVEHKMKLLGTLALPSISTNVFLLFSLLSLTALVVLIRRRMRRSNPRSEVPNPGDAAVAADLMEPLALPLEDGRNRLAQSATISELEANPIIRVRGGNQSSSQGKIIPTPKRREPDRQEQ